ncbi:MAG: 1,4-alpha-glucan branching protein domain-containing protein [Promethearchaeota archaeon]
MFFSLVLHGHIPFCRKSGTWPAGEEWLHEAIIESYLPLLRVITDLKDMGIPAHINVEFTPILLEQLADPYMQEKFVIYLEDLVRRARGDVDRFTGRPLFKNTAEHYLSEFTYFLDYYKDTIKRDVIGAYRRLQDAGIIEIFTSAATHGFLPLLSQDSAIWSQLKIGVDTYKKYFNRHPDGVWLPECAFRPMVSEGGRIRAGIDYWLKKAGLKYFIVNYTGFDSAILSQANPAGVKYISSFECYHLAGTGRCVFGRNYETSEKVWSANTGYPGNRVYREFHLKDSISGLRYHVVSEKQSFKEAYIHKNALSQTKADADDFARIIQGTLQDYHNINGRDGIVVSPYDFELFGHWWYEGPAWIRQVLINLAETPVESTKLSDFIRTREDSLSEIILEKTSWGEGGGFKVWQNEEHGWIWNYINGSARELEHILAQVNQPRNDVEHRVLKQLARELLLMAGSDWPFLLYTKQATQYANQRFHWHHQRFSTLAWAAKNFDDTSRLNITYLEEVEGIDNCFPDIDINLFRTMK